VRCYEIYVLELCQLFVADLYVELLELKTVYGNVHDTTMESVPPAAVLCAHDEVFRVAR
jgi:hypothetical protein